MICVECYIGYISFLLFGFGGFIYDYPGDEIVVRNHHRIDCLDIFTAHYLVNCVHIKLVDEQLCAEGEPVIFEFSQDLL